jgi:hypothetical protein
MTGSPATSNGSTAVVSDRFHDPISYGYFDVRLKPQEL